MATRERRRAARLFLMIRVLVLLPGTPPGVAAVDLRAEIELPERTFRRLMADIRDAGLIVATSECDGRKTYYLAPLGADMLRKLGLL